MITSTHDDPVLGAVAELSKSVEKLAHNMDKQNDEIMTAMSKFADSVDRRFDKLESDVAELKSDVTELKSDVQRIYSILDAHMARIERIIEGNSVQSHQQARLERWIFQLADQAGVKLRYDS